MKVKITDTLQAKIIKIINNYIVDDVLGVDETAEAASEIEDLFKEILEKEKQKVRDDYKEIEK